MADGRPDPLDNSARPDPEGRESNPQAEAAKRARQQLSQGALEGPSQLEGRREAGGNTPYDFLRAESQLLTPGRGTPQEFQARSLRAEGNGMPLETSFKTDSGEQISGTLIRGKEVFKAAGQDGTIRTFDVREGNNGKIQLVDRSNPSQVLDVERGESQISRRINMGPPYGQHTSMNVRRFDAGTQTGTGEIPASGLERGLGPPGGFRPGARIEQGQTPAVGESPSLINKPGARPAAAQVEVAANAAPQAERTFRVELPPGAQADRSNLPQEQVARFENLRAQILSGNVKSSDLQALRADNLDSGNLRESLKNPEFRQNLQKAMESMGRGNNMLDADMSGKGSEALIRLLQKGESGKIPGLDKADPQTAKFLTELGNRLQSLKTGSPEAGTVTLSQLLKGMEPGRSEILTKFLTSGSDALPGGNRLSQLDAGNMNILRSLIKSGTESGINTTGDASLNRSVLASTLMQVLSGRSTAAGASPEISAGLRASGSSGNIVELGNILNSLTRQMQGDSAGKPFLLGDAISRNFTGTNNDSGVTNTTRSIIRELTANLSPSQESTIKAMLSNSNTLANLLEIGRSPALRAELGVTGTAVLGEAIRTLVRGESGGAEADIRTRIGERQANPGQGEATASNFRGDGNAAAMRALTGITGDTNIPPGMTAREYVSRMPIDPVSGMPYDPSTGKLLDPSTGRAVGSFRPEGDSRKNVDSRQDEKESKRRLDEEKEDLEREDAKERARLKALMLLEKARKLKELDEKEKEEKEKRNKEEDEKRTKYICKDGDTIQSVALSQLKDIRTAPLIYRINKEIIPLKGEGTRAVAVLHAGLVLWLPAPGEVRRFKGQLMTHQVSDPDTASGGSASSLSPDLGQRGYDSPEEELAAMFGANWSGPKPEDEEKDPHIKAQKASEYTPNGIELQLMSEAMEAARIRRANIEKSLGPITTDKAPIAKDERLKYTIRLGDSLKSIAARHPSLNDVSLWRLLADTNGLSRETDSRGLPTATLERGKEILIPSRKEIEEFKRKSGESQTVSNLMAGKSKMELRRATKPCSRCGRLCVKRASICPGCGTAFEDLSELATTVQNPQTTRSSQSTSSGKASDHMQESNEIKQEDGDTVLAPAPDKIRRSNLSSQGKIDESLIDTAESPIMDNKSTAQTKFLDLKLLRQLEERARIMTCERGTSCIIQLQYKFDPPDLDAFGHSSSHSDEDIWQPVVEYEIAHMRTLRRNFKNGEPGKTVTMSLPEAAARELALNDLTTNWRNYSAISRD